MIKLGSFNQQSINWQKIAIVIIFLLAIFLRFYALDRADVLTDEALVSFRSIGYFDWLATPYQTTILEWMNDRPLWSYLSFHDHPPFSFFLQFIQFKITGVSVWAMRFWPALYGVLSVMILYLITRRLFNRKLALLSAALLAVNSLHIWVSRLALQESLTILLMLLSCWIFLLALKKKKFFYLWGAIIGLALLTKLTAIILLPIFFFYLIFCRRDVFKFKELYLGALISLAIFSPYIIYNIFVFKNFGHFDFQLSFLLKQQVEAWQIRPGRADVPTKSQVLQFTYLGLRYSVSPLFFYASLAGLVLIIYKLIRDKLHSIDPAYYFLLIIIIFHIVLFVFIGPGARFLSLIIPWLSIILALFLYFLFKVIGKNISWILLILIIIFQVFFSFSTNISQSKFGKETWVHSVLKKQAYPYGHNQLENYFDKLLANKKPAVLLPVVNPNINNFIVKQADKLAGEPAAIMIIYDPRMYAESILWFIIRRFLYQGWPTLSYDTYQQAIDQQGEDFFQSLGIEEFYYIAPTDKMILESVQNSELNQKIVDFEKNLQADNLPIDKIYNLQEQEVFNIYRF